MAEEDNRPGHPSAKFGGFQFTHELELCFADLTELLGQLLNSEVKNLPHPVGLILGNVHHCATGLLSLGNEQLVSEAYLVMRVLVDSVVTASYLLAADEKERQRYLAQKVPSGALRGEGPEQLIEHAKFLREVDQIPAHRLGPIAERIDVLCERTATNPDSWRVLVASVFPFSAELLAGSPGAYAFRFTRNPSEEQGGAGNEFSMLFFMGSEMLCELMGFCSNHVHIDQLSEKTCRVHDRLIELMKRRNIGISDPVQGAWHRLNKLEFLGARKLAPQISDFENAFGLTYEATIVAPTLRKPEDRGNFKHAALYFRRALNDLRTVWLLISKGYTAQASACAGSLFECCLASICLLQPDRVQEFESWLKSVDGNDFPWGTMKMAQMASAPTADLDNPDPAYQNSWRSLYARYVWLSQIRHSTFQSVLHDVRGGTLASGEYVQMAIPNCSEEDLAVKLGIVVGALADIQHAAGAMLKAFGYEDETGNLIFDTRWPKAKEALSNLVAKLATSENPITIARTRFARRHPPVPNQSGSMKPPAPPVQ
jgi:hypothetical protein